MLYSWALHNTVGKKSEALGGGSYYGCTVLSGESDAKAAVSGRKQATSAQKANFDHREPN